MKRKTYIFSMDAPECQRCSNYDDCQSKRRVLCMYLEPLTNPAAENLTQPIMADMLVKHDYRDIKIAENTNVTIDLEKMKKNLAEDIYKAINCSFLQGGA